MDIERVTEKVAPLPRRRDVSGSMSRWRQCDVICFSADDCS